MTGQAKSEQTSNTTESKRYEDIPEKLVIYDMADIMARYATGTEYNIYLAEAVSYGKRYIAKLTGAKVRRAKSNVYEIHYQTILASQDIKRCYGCVGVREILNEPGTIEVVVQ